MRTLSIQEQLQAARHLISARRLREAQALLVGPATSDAPESHHLLGVIARLQGQSAEAEARQRAALAIDPAYDDAAVELARLCNATGRHAETIACTSASAAAGRPSQALLVERARAWQSLDRPDQRLETRERIAELYPATSATLHNLAAALGDAGHAARGEAAARAALALGGDAPETWLVLARALQNQNRFAEADAAFAEALARRPAYADALRDRAQLLWMTSGDRARVLELLDFAGTAFDPMVLRKLKARFVAATGAEQEAYRLLTADVKQPDAELEALAAKLSLTYDPERALVHARRAEALSPDAAEVRRVLIDALLALRQTAEASRRIDRERAVVPGDPALIAARWTAWRIDGDPRARALYDYESSVLAQTIATPRGWTSLQAYLADLADALERLHGFEAHPLDQSLRGGGQTSANLLRSQEPVIMAFQEAIDAPVRRYLARARSGRGLLGQRIGEDYRIAGMWSVRLRSGGFHQTHVHPLGWISSACYIVVPPAHSGAQAARSGWLKLGQPPAPALPPGHFVQPDPGLLVLFPSYMWHGTEPFQGEGARLTIAFDIAPTTPELPG